MDTLELPYRFIPDGEPLPDLSAFRDPIILRARWEAEEGPVQAAPRPDAYAAPEETPAPSLDMDAADAPSANDLITPAYPELVFFGGLKFGQLGLRALIALGRQVLRPQSIGGPGDPIGPGAVGNGNRSAAHTVPQEAAPEIRIDPRQLQSKFKKHADEFGIEGNWSPAQGERYAEAIRNFIRQPQIRYIRGRYHGQQVGVYFDPATDRVILADPSGNFISGWRLTGSQLTRFLRDRVIR